jgi:hypothetical protein
MVPCARPGEHDRKLPSERLNAPSMIDANSAARDAAAGARGGFSWPHEVHKRLKDDPVYSSGS